MTFCPVKFTASFTTDSYRRSLETEGEISPNFEYIRLIAKNNIIFEPINFATLKIIFFPTVFTFEVVT